MKVHTDVSSKTMYLAKNQRTIEYFRDEKISRRESNRTLNTTKTDQSYKYVEEMLNIQLKENEVSHLSITTTVSDDLLRQILRQINKLIDVLVAVEDKN